VSRIPTPPMVWSPALNLHSYILPICTECIISPTYIIFPFHGLAGSGVLDTTLDLNLESGVGNAGPYIHNTTHNMYTYTDTHIHYTLIIHIVYIIYIIIYTFTYVHKGKEINALRNMIYVYNIILCNCNDSTASSWLHMVSACPGVKRHFLRGPVGTDAVKTWVILVDGSCGDVKLGKTSAFTWHSVWFCMESKDMVMGQYPGT